MLWKRIESLVFSLCTFQDLELPTKEPSRILKGKHVLESGDREAVWLKSYISGLITVYYNPLKYKHLETGSKHYTFLFFSQGLRHCQYHTYDNDCFAVADADGDDNDDDDDNGSSQSLRQTVQLSPGTNLKHQTESVAAVA